MTPFEIAHFSDTHLGYEAYEAESPSGQNQRGEDIVRAFERVVDDILAADPAMVIHSGDVAEKPVVPIQYWVYAIGAFERLTRRRDGSVRPVVVIAGNHDPSHRHRDACWLEILRVIPNVHVVTSGYEKIRFTDDDVAAGVDPALVDVVVHAIPHDSLRRIDNWDTVRPTDGKVNVLTTHGVAHGLKVFTRALGREYAIPNEVLARRWEYVALGHYHKRGPVGVADSGDVTSSHVWYAGSPEYISFRDLKDNAERRGYLRVTVNPGGDPDVVEVDLPTRAVFRLPVLDATGLSPAEITEALIANVEAASTNGAVVGQIIEGVTRDTYSLVEKTRVRAAASDALYFELVPRFATPERTEDGASRSASGLGDVETVLGQVAERLTSSGEIPADLAAEVRDTAAKFLSDVLARYGHADTDTTTGADSAPSEEDAA